MSIDKNEQTAAYAAHRQELSHNTGRATDVRSLRTRIQIRDALMALLLEGNFDQITVSALVKRAGINRATFYRHYSDIYDLAHRLTEVLFMDVEAHLAAVYRDEKLEPHQSGSVAGGGLPPQQRESRIDPGHGWEILFEHVAEYAQFYRAMLQPGGIPGFRARVEAVVEAQMLALLPSYGFRPEASRIPVALAVRYLAAAQVGFVQWWLEHDMPFPPVEAARHLLTLHVMGGTWALGLDLGAGIEE